MAKKRVQYQVTLVYDIESHDGMSQEVQEDLIDTALSEIKEVLTDGGYVVAIEPGIYTIEEE